MPGSLWAGLPVELVLLVIQQTDDKQTLLNWCKATRGNAILQQDSLLYAWKDSCICANDLLLAPDEIENEEWALRPEAGRSKADHDPDDLQVDPDTWPPPRIKTIPGTGVSRRHTARLLRGNRQNPNSKINQAFTSFGNLVPAHSIRHLRLDLRIETLLSSEYPRLQPSIQSLVYSLKVLFPHLNNVENLVLDGPTPSEVIHQVAKQLNPSKLKSLTVRASYTDYIYLRDDVEPGTGCEVIDFAGLTKFKELETLIVKDLVRGDHSSLCGVLSKLTSLKRLDVSVRPYTEAERLYAPGNSISPLELLVGGSARSHHDGSLLCHLPPSLKSLRMVDNYYLGPMGFTYPLAPVDYDASSSLALEELITELDDLHSTASILSWLPRSRLRRLSISLVSEEYGFHDSVEALSYANSLLKMHLGTLQEVVFSNAWRLHLPFPREFDRAWGSVFRITDLVLGTDPGPAREDSGPLLTIYDYLATVSLDMDLGLYLMRLRIESNIEDNGTANDDDPGGTRLKSLLGHRKAFEHIRILIVSPKRPGDIQDKGHQGTWIDTSKEEMLAWRITRHGPPSLRYISIGQCSFWVDRSEGSSDFTLVSWSHATGGLDLRLKWDVHKWATRDDLDFIDPLSRLNRERHGVEVPSTPSYKQLLRWNFLVARRVDGVTTDPET